MTRRDRIGATYLPRINPIVEPVLAGASLTFGNAAVDHAVAPAPTSYQARWFAFDNATGTSREIAVTTATTTRVAAPDGLPQDVGAFVRVDLSADHPQLRVVATADRDLLPAGGARGGPSSA